MTTSFAVEEEIPSPNRQWKAVVTYWTPPGGPLADDQWTIHVLPATDRVPMWVRGRSRAGALWFSEYLPPAYVFWRDDRSLVVLVHKQPNEVMSWIRERPAGLDVETRVLRGRDKSSLRWPEQLPRAKVRR